MKRAWLLKFQFLTCSECWLLCSLWHVFLGWSNSLQRLSFSPDEVTYSGQREYYMQIRRVTTGKEECPWQSSETTLVQDILKWTTYSVPCSSTSLSPRASVPWVRQVILQDWLSYAHHGSYWLALVKARGELNMPIIWGKKLGKHDYFKMPHFFI